MAYGLYTAGVSVRSGMTEFASFLAVVDFETVVEGLLGAIFGTLLILLIGVMIFGAGYSLYFLFSLPRRRLERAMIFLNIVDSGIRRNVTPEETIKSAAACCDNSVSVRFHLLAAWIERGATWREAVGLVPRLLPPRVMEMLLMADRVGGWSKIFPVCQRQLAD
ncbi:MAG: hypothetical protein K0Q55_1482, partial [Verrucomicrobia bacterium]|nr:hypothetical protein [Verrucomicrobiota bacterium]